MVLSMSCMGGGVEDHPRMGHEFTNTGVPIREFVKYSWTVQGLSPKGDNNMG